MNRDKQLKLIKKCLKDLGVTGIKLVDGNSLPNINEKHKDKFLGTNIDTFFLCDEQKLEIVDYYCVEYENYYVYFNNSMYMQYALNGFKPTPEIKSITLNGKIIK